MPPPDPRPDHCVYCGGLATTTDHVPPKAVFPERKGALAVPSCGPCNNGASKDDEYFAVVTARRDRDGKAPAGAAEVTARMLRALERPQARGFQETIRRDTFLVAPRSPAGLYLPVESWTRVSVDRVERVLQRVVRGLYWARTGERLPRGLRIYAYPWETLTLEQVCEISGYGVGNWDHGKLGDTVFAYRATRFEPFGEHGTLWVLGFFGTLDYVVATGALVPVANPD